MKRFLLNIRSELLKTKKSSSIWLTFFAGTIIPFVFFIAAINRTSEDIKNYGPDPWFLFLNEHGQIAASLMMGAYIILLCGLIAQIEYRNGTWKQVFASPRSYFDIYVSKFIVILLFIFLGLVIFDLSFILSEYAAMYLQNKYDYSHTPLHIKELIKMSLKMFISVLAISAIQYWMAVRFKNFIVSFGIGLAVFLTCAIIGGHWEKIRYAPYSYPWQIFIDQSAGLTGKVHDTLINSIAVFFVVILFGFLDLVYKKEKA